MDRTIVICYTPLIYAFTFIILCRFLFSLLFYKVFSHVNRMQKFAKINNHSLHNEIFSLPYFHWNTSFNYYIGFRDEKSHKISQRRFSGKLWDEISIEISHAKKHFEYKTPKKSIIPNVTKSVWIVTKFYAEKNTCCITKSCRNVPLRNSYGIAPNVELGLFTTIFICMNRHTGRRKTPMKRKHGDETVRPIIYSDR